MDRFKFRVWNNAINAYVKCCAGEEMFLSANGEIFCYDKETGRMTGAFHCDIEQCTGLRDKNGKLIYIGDIVAIKIKGLPDDIRTVEYDEDGIDGIYPFYLSHDCGDDCHCKLRDFPEYACEIIGNIHTQVKE